MLNLKKAASLFILVFGLMLTAQAQNGAFVTNPSDGQTITYVSFATSDLYIGVYTLIVTPKGKVNFSFSGELVNPGTATPLDKAVQEGATQFFLGYNIEYRCTLTPSGNINCKGTGV